MCFPCMQKNTPIFYTRGIQITEIEKGFMEAKYLSFREVIFHIPVMIWRSVIGSLRNNRGSFIINPIYTPYIAYLFYDCVRSPFSEKNLVVREEDSQRLRQTVDPMGGQLRLHHLTIQLLGSKAGETHRPKHPPIFLGGFQMLIFRGVLSFVCVLYRVFLRYYQCKSAAFGFQTTCKGSDFWAIGKFWFPWALQDIPELQNEKDTSPFQKRKINFHCSPIEFPGQRGNKPKNQKTKTSKGKSISDLQVILFKWPLRLPGLEVT